MINTSMALSCSLTFRFWYRVNASSNRPASVTMAAMSAPSKLSALARELGRLQHGLVQELDEFVGQLGVHERPHGARHLLRIVALRQRRGDDLVDEHALVRVVVRQDLGPQVEVHAVAEVASLRLEERVLVGALHEVVVALAAGVRHHRQIRVALLAVLAHNGAVIERVGVEEVLRVLVGVDVDFGDGVVHRGVLRALVDARLEPWLDLLELVALSRARRCGTRRTAARARRLPRAEQREQRRPYCQLSSPSPSASAILSIAVACCSSRRIARRLSVEPTVSAVSIAMVASA